MDCTNIKKGDIVIIAFKNVFCPYTTIEREVIKVTKNLIYVNGDKYRRTDGTMEKSNPFGTYKIIGVK